MNNPHRLNEAYAAHFKNWFTNNHTISKQAYFVTITFEHEARRRQRRQAEGLSQGSFEWDAFNHLYNLTCRNLIGRNYHRSCNRSLLPHVAAFLDAEGTRHWRSAGDLTNLHFHSIWLIDESNVSQFEEAMNVNGSMGDGWRSLSFDEIDVKPIDTSTDDDVERAISYASKLMGFNNEHLSVGIDFEVYPKPKH